MVNHGVIFVEIRGNYKETHRGNGGGISEDSIKLTVTISFIQNLLLVKDV